MQLLIDYYVIFSLVIPRNHLFMSSSQPGPFIYKGAGRKQSLDASAAQKECTREACNIQYCLAKRNHQESRCKDAIDAWKTCCAKVEARDTALKALNPGAN